jgi:hypothetical protein
VIRAVAQTKPATLAATSQRRGTQLRRRAFRPPVSTFTLPPIQETESSHREASTRTRIRLVRGLTRLASPQRLRCPLQPRRSEHRLVRIPPPRPQGQTITPPPSEQNRVFTLWAASSSVPVSSQRGHFVSNLLRPGRIAATRARATQRQGPHRGRTHRGTGTNRIPRTAWLSQAAWLLGLDGARLDSNRARWVTCPLRRSSERSRASAGIGGSIVAPREA